MRRRSAVLIVTSLLAAAGGLGVGAQDLTPWRQGVVQPKADAGFWWMAGEGGFARRQGLGLRIVAFDSDLDMVKALRAGELDSFEGSPIQSQRTRHS